MGLALAALIGFPTIGVAPARADFGVSDFDVTFTGPLGETVTQAGAHPFQMDTKLEFDSIENGAGGRELEEVAKDFYATQMPGFVGNPTAVPRCSSADFLTQSAEFPGTPDCPNASALGYAIVSLAVPAAVEGDEEGQNAEFRGAIYNLAPPPGVAAKLGFWISQFPVTIELGVEESFPYRIVGGPTNISQAGEVIASDLVLWGNPAASSHDALRGHCFDTGSGGSRGICHAGLPEKPFLTLPRACQGPLRTEYATDSWQHPGLKLENGLPDLTDPSWVRGFSETHGPSAEPLGMSGCGKLSFGPQIGVRPSTSEAESPAGLELAIDVEDEGVSNPDGLAQADIEATEFRLPAGMTINPGAAEGLGVCTQAQFQTASLRDQGCPSSSKLGTLEVDTPILENHTLRGAFYQAAPHDNRFGSLLAAYLTIKDEELGVFVKLPVRIETDPQTGQIVTTVKNMPPFPLEHVLVKLRQGPRAPLITPPTCGTYGTEAKLWPSSGEEPLQVSSSFQVTSGPGGGPCPGAQPFAPGFEAGAADASAGRYSPFSMRITRQDGEQDITRFSAVLPPGEVAKIAGVPPCSDAAIEAAKAKSGKAELASPSCPAASKIGEVLAGAGVGSALTYVPGTLYLAGPYKGSELSVVSIVPAVAGPFDVGTVVTRVGLKLIPETGEAEVDGAASDPIPHILKGIPLKLRDLRVYVNRPDFTLNPTSCNVFTTRAQIAGSGANPFIDSDDTLASAAARYQASSCASLAFKPGLKIQLKGETKRGGFPRLHSVVTYPKGSGYANIGRAVVTLPHSAFISPIRVSNPCTRPAFAEGKCPPASRLGYAKAWTPLLNEPLQGPVYFRSNGGVRDIPDIVADLNGQFHVILVGAVDSVGPSNKARLRTTFANVPDAPVSRFELNLKGGKEGVIENSANLCGAKRYVKVKLRGQNGRVREFKTKQQVKCGGGKAKRQVRHSRRR